MIQGILLIILIVLCSLLGVTLIIHPFGSSNKYDFKIKKPRYKKEDKKAIASFDIFIEI
jgi:hypothetical protein